jgi:tetraprenyl-beta-curcumene synthase
MAGGGRALGGALSALSVYQGAVLPRIDREREHWLERAAQVPDPVLREQALSSLREKSANVDATGVFATLAPRRNRAAVIRAGACLQIAVDYLDTVSEDADGPNRLEDGLRLHRALLAGITGERPDDPYRAHGRNQDGGYLAELLAECAHAGASLPRMAECRPALLGAVARCGEGQAHTHATSGGDADALKVWADGLDAPPGYASWEIAAGASSSVAAHALLALAADASASGTDAARVDAAYFPSIGALTVLLDDLVDLEEDLAAGEHNYISYYADDQDVADRLGSIADRAEATLEPLPHRFRHEAILAGVIGFYLARPAARAPRWTPTRERLLDSLGLPARVLALFSRLRDHG